MIKICTVYFKGKYNPDYVSKLYRSIKRNTSIPFQSICLSDTKDVEADIVLPYNHHSPIPLHWHKLKFFSPHFAYQNPNDEIIIMDIDQVIVNNIDKMIGWPVSDNELVTYNSWWNAKLPINGGWYKFKSNTVNGIWNDFIRGVKYWPTHYYNSGKVHEKYYGEQNFVYERCRYNNIKLTLMNPEWLGNYSTDLKTNVRYNAIYCNKFNTDYMLLDKPNNNLKVVHLAGVDKNLHDIKETWIKEYWK